MATVMLLLPESSEVTLGQSGTDELATVGISHLSVLHDEHAVAVILEGWSFDPLRSLDDVVVALGICGPVRVLHEHAHIAVRAADTGGTAR